MYISYWHGLFGLITCLHPLENYIRALDNIFISVGGLLYYGFNYLLWKCAYAEKTYNTDRTLR